MKYKDTSILNMSVVPELVHVYKQSTCKRLSYKPISRLPSVSVAPSVIWQATDHH